MELVVKLARQEEEQQAREFENAKKELTHQTKLLHDLQHYYSDYEKNFTSKNSGLRGFELSQKRDFLKNLADAQLNQKRQIDNAKLVVDHQTAVWRQKYLKRQTLENLVGRIRKQELQAKEKLEQKAIEEWVMQSLNKKR